MYDFQHSEKKWVNFLIAVKKETLTPEIERETADLCFGHSLKTEIFIFEQRKVLEELGDNVYSKTEEIENNFNFVLYLIRLMQFLFWINDLSSNFENKCNEIICKILNKKFTSAEGEIILKKIEGLISQ